MMTTFAAIFGALPIALGAGAGAELRQPLGVAVVGGLCVSQLLTLFITPVIYVYLDRIDRVLRRRLEPQLEEVGGAIASGSCSRTGRSGCDNRCAAQPRRTTRAPVDLYREAGAAPHDAVATGLLILNAAPIRSLT